MDTAVEVRGSERDRLIEKLLVEKTLVKMSVGNGKAATVTVVTGVRTQGKESLFTVDCPDWMRPYLLEPGPGGIYFEWTGADDIPYRFSVHDVRAEGREIWMAVPETIWYCQKRRHFRINAPEGTFLAFRGGEHAFRMALSNISLGGLRCEQWAAKTLPVDLTLREGDVLENAELHFRSGETIPVRRAEVRWVERSQKTARRRYGIQFKELDKQDERELTAIVYRCQREYLRKRLPVDDGAWKRIL